MAPTNDNQVYYVVRAEPEMVRAALSSPSLVPEVPELREFTGSLSNLGILQLLPAEEHHAYRQQLNPFFSAMGAGRWGPRITELCDDHLRGLVTRHAPYSLKKLILQPVVERAAAQLVGIPDTLATEVAPFARTVGSVVSASKSRRIVAMIRLSRTLGAALDDAKVSSEGPQSLLATFRNKLPPTVLIGVAVAVLSVGTELTIRATLSVLLESLAKARAGQNASLDPHNVDDTVARARIIEFAERRAICSTRLNGHPLKSGELLKVPLCPGIPRHSDDAEPWKGTGWRLPFGFGPHFCLGASWARVVIRSIVPMTLEALQTSDVLDVQYASPNDPLGGIVDARVLAEEE